MRVHALRPYTFVLAAAFATLSVVSFARAGAPASTPASAPERPWPMSSDPLLAEIQTHFRATKKWFGMVSDLVLDRAADGTFTPRYETLQSKFVQIHDAAGQTLHPRLPPLANAAHVVEFDGVNGFSVRTEEIGMQPVPAEVHQGVIVYRGAVAGGDLLYKLTPTHLDEYVYFRDPPAHLRREFAYDTGSAVWTLREADGMIEALGKDGVSRLRLTAPLARAADGKRRRGTARIVGRTIITEIDLTGLTAPILVDPDWATTGSMSTAHWGDTGYRRPDGHVMAVGGCALTGCPANFTNTACGQMLANSDVWNPDSGTWTPGAAMITARTTFAGVPLPSGDLLVAGGCTETNCTQMNDAGFCLAQPCVQTTNLSERYSYATNSWVATGSLPTSVAAPMAAPIGDGGALVAGGCDLNAGCSASAEGWTAAANAWSSLASLPGPRGYGTATVLADGRVLVVGGCADPLCATVLGDALVYDPVANTWTPAGSMSSPRAGQTATLLPNGTVLVAGGCVDAACMNVLSSVDIWTASGASSDAGGGAGSFAPGPSMATARHHHTATLLGNHEVLMAGGANASGASLPTSEVYLPLAQEWLGTTAMLMARAFHVGALLNDGRVLVAGGCNPATCISFAETFSPATLPADSDAGVDAASLESEDSGSGAAAPTGPAPLPTSAHPDLYHTGVNLGECATDTTQDLACPVAGWELQDSDFWPNDQALVQTANDEVTDNHTGLIWQRGDDGNLYTYAQAGPHCAGFKSAEAATGWRLPSVVELMTLIDEGIYLPSISPNFAGAQSNNYWSSTPTAMTENMQSWTVKFDFGEVIPFLADTPLPVRCVRGTSPILNVGGQDGGVGLRKAGPLTPTALTVQDTTTGLEWQRTDDGVKRGWKDSLDYCSRLSLGGLSGWHLPNISELLGIVQYDGLNANGVAIDPAFTGAQADLYWTSTQNEGLPTLTWSITFNLGVVDGVTVSGLGYARCVRHLPLAPVVAPSCGCQVPGASGGATGGALAASALAALAVLLARRPRARERKTGR